MNKYISKDIVDNRSPKNTTQNNGNIPRGQQQQEQQCCLYILKDLEANFYSVLTIFEE